MPIDKDTRLIAELSPLQIGAITTVATTMTVPAVVQHLIGNLGLATGRSMLPTFPKRCIVGYKTVPWEQLKVGDIPIILLKKEYLLKYAQQISQTDKDYNTLKDKIFKMLNKKPESISHFLHRIIRKTDRGFVTKGDGNQNPDQELLTKETYGGRVVDKVVLDLSGKITGPVLEGLWSLLKNYKPII